MRTDRNTRLLALLICLFTSSASVAASIESLVMPGPVAEAHAETEETCSACHGLFDRGSQKGLCLDCHEDIAADLDQDRGLHGHHPDVREGECRACHTEHEGREADITGLQPSLFDHEQTGFTLTGAHAAESCGSCHETGTPFREVEATCAGCHQADDPHDGGFDVSCGDCHTPAGWQQAEFDHDSTDFPLLGSHRDAACLGCHADQRFEAPASECVDCHRSDDAHNGTNGDSCGDCHGSSSWSDSHFDHFEETGYRLEGAHAELSCGNCHVEPGGYEALPTDCVGCHASDDVHLGRNGTDCAECHQQNAWSRSFDHLAETGYALLGAHAEQSCGSCHTEGFEQPLAIECAGCHRSDDPHQGTLLECDDCHGQNAWDTEQRFQHDMAAFALVGLHRVASCEQCHDSMVFSPVAYDCIDCHAEDDVHEGAMGGRCQDCHNPAGWSYWLFDHEQATGFALGGAHEELVCADCHPPGQRAERQARACVTCHRADDIHAGRFGQNCDRCHLTTSFEALKDGF